MRYCKIKNCKFYFGVGDAEVHMFRPPRDADWREKWDAALATQICTSGSLVCIEHFHKDDILIKNKTISLRKLAVPSIFAICDDRCDVGIDVEPTFECTQSDAISVEELKQMIESQTNVIQKLNETNEELSGQLDTMKNCHDENRILTQKIKRLEKVNQSLEFQLDAFKNSKQQINSLEEIIQSLKSQLDTFTNTRKNCCQTNLGQFAAKAVETNDMKVKRQEKILSCLAVGIKHRESYPDDVRNFCISLNNISPAGYRFLRSQFNNTIPTPCTLRAWHSNADVNAKPGILSQSLEMLKRKASEKSANGEKLIGGLLFDEVSIRKMLQWANNEMIGFECVPGLDNKNASIATQSIVFMFSGINDQIQVPVAYYFIAKLDSNAKSILIEEVMKAVIDCGVILTSLTFDGFKSNPVACRIFGANLDVFSPTFDSSFNFKNCSICSLFDPSHVIKLIRGAMAKNIIYDDEQKPIKWIYIERLVRFRSQRNIGSMHKLTQAHLDFQSNAMKVILAVQTLSNKTANAIEYFMNEGHAEFAGAEATIKFIRLFNDLFDVFNSTSNSKDNPFKKMMSRDNASQIFELFERASNYIKGLKIRNDRGNFVNICSSSLKTGFQGCIVNIKTFT